MAAVFSFVVTAGHELWPTTVLLQRFREKKKMEIDKCFCCRDAKQPLLFNVCPKQTAYKSGWVKKWSAYIILIDENSFSDGATVGEATAGRRGLACVTRVKED
ncbi:uncharacterized protein LOC111497672 isoform X2 [Cucurbita maxima]|uniref:Uncharacterized protein LOC111497672 isoform X2 n=1 Tax=Cucurbita maxima TaxID=3661 RepID=A0A6J1KZ40_CUCMA|nr:uncharacterized protein LOC111497672 isoform X2 [Cucurbita maxima]